MDREHAADGQTGAAQESEADARAREIEQQMTDDERFSLIVCVMGAIPGINPFQDKRLPEGLPMSAGYTPGVPRLGDEWELDGRRVNRAGDGITSRRDRRVAVAQPDDGDRELVDPV